MPCFPKKKNQRLNISSIYTATFTAPRGGEDLNLFPWLRQTLSPEPREPGKHFHQCISGFLHVLQLPLCQCSQNYTSLRGSIITPETPTEPTRPSNSCYGDDTCIISHTDRTGLSPGAFFKIVMNVFSETSTEKALKEPEKWPHLMERVHATQSERCHLVGGFSHRRVFKAV